MQRKDSLSFLLFLLPHPHYQDAPGSYGAFALEAVLEVWLLGLAGLSQFSWLILQTHCPLQRPSEGPELMALTLLAQGGLWLGGVCIWPVLLFCRLCKIWTLFVLLGGWHCRNACGPISTFCPLTASDSTKNLLEDSNKHQLGRKHSYSVDSGLNGWGLYKLYTSLMFADVLHSLLLSVHSVIALYCRLSLYTILKENQGKNSVCLI